MLYNVLLDVSAETGIHKTQKRSVLLNLLQRAAKEMHSRLDCVKINREVTLVVPANKQVTLPTYIGELRGLREHVTEQTMNLSSLIYPRYVKDTIGFRTRCWRDKGDVALHTPMSAIGPLIFRTQQVEDVDILISGQSSIAALDEETVSFTIAAGEDEVSTQKLFGPEISTICSFSNRTADITVVNSTGTELAVLYSNFQRTRYKIIDISEFGWSVDTSNSETLVDVMYKVPATPLRFDSDQFYAGDEYDEAWFCMAMAKYFEPQENRQEDFKKYLARCAKIMEKVKADTEQGITHHLNFGQNKFYVAQNLYAGCPGIFR